MVCLHCFCQQDTGGNWHCCKCGERLPYPPLKLVTGFPVVTMKPFVWPSDTAAGPPSLELEVVGG